MIGGCCMRELFYKVVKLDSVVVNVDLLMTTFYYSGKPYATHFRDVTVRVKNVYMDDNSVLHIGKDTVIEDIKYVPTFEDVDVLFRKRFDINRLFLEALEGIVIKTNIKPGDFSRSDTIDVAWVETEVAVNNSFGIKNKSHSLTGAGIKVTVRVMNGELFDRKSVIDFIEDSQPELEFMSDD